MKEHIRALKNNDTQKSFLERRLTQNDTELWIEPHGPLTTVDAQRTFGTRSLRDHDVPNV